MKSEHTFNLQNNNFDLIRLFAALQVAIIHTIAHLDLDIHIPLLEYFPGVPIFFFVSGFLISLSFERNSNYKIYAQNRVLRIYPALIVCFIVSIASVLLSGFELKFDFNFFKWMGAQLTFLQFYNPDFLRNYGVGTLNGSLWTIPVELAFYLFLPFIYYLGNKINNLDIVLGVSLVISIFVAAFYQLYKPQYEEEVWFKLIGVSLFPFLWMFMIGVFFQRKWEYIEILIKGKFILWFAIFIITAVSSPYVWFLNASNQPSVIYFLILVLFISSFAIHKNGRWSKVLRDYDLSYGVYIYHMIVVNFMLAMGSYGNGHHFVVAFVAIFILSLISWKFVEKPALRLKPKSIRRI
jgi:peptidoglycan/LPS O-acetylase OafA/YrhL